MAMVSAAVTQYYIYKKSPCGKNINAQMDAGRKDCAADITVWVQVFPYGLVGFSEVMASITKLEYAFTKAPTNMRSTVQGLALLTSAISSALGQAFTGLSEDPLLVWNYTTVACIAFLGGSGFWVTFRNADRDEDRLNNIEKSRYGMDSESEKDVNEMSQH